MAIDGVIWGIRRNDMIDKPIKNISPDEIKVKKIFRELRTWARRDFRNSPEIWPELVASHLRWEVQQ